MDLSGYVFEALRKDEEFILYRGQSKDVASQVLVLLPMAEYPRAESLKRLEHEYSLREELDPTWVARPIAMARHWDRTVLVLEDPGGVPLDQLLGHPSDLVFSLRLAVALSSAIDQLHQRDIIHKDIKPGFAKTAEERYQTTTGVESDLRRCLAEWETQHRVDQFPLGDHDAPDRLLGSASPPSSMSSTRCLFRPAVFLRQASSTSTSVSSLMPL